MEVRFRPLADAGSHVQDEAIAKSRACATFHLSDLLDPRQRNLAKAREFDGHFVGLVLSRPVRCIDVTIFMGIRDNFAVPNKIAPHVDLPPKQGSRH